MDSGIRKEHWLRKQFEEAVKDTVKDIKRLRDMEKRWRPYYDFIDVVQLKEMNLGLGTAEVNMGVKKDLFFKVLSELSDINITGEHELIQLMRELTMAKKAYDKVAKALDDVQKVGYGIVPPQLDEMTMEEPKIVRQGAKFGIKLKAVAPSIHMIRTDINAEVSPIIGKENKVKN